MGSVAIVVILDTEILEAGVGARQPRSGYTESVSREVAVGNRSLLQVPLELDDTPHPPPPPPVDPNPPSPPTEPQGWARKAGGTDRNSVAMHVSDLSVSGSKQQPAAAEFLCT